MPNEINIARIAITSDSISHRNYLKKVLQENGAEVVLNQALTKKFVNEVNLLDCDVILFDSAAVEDEHLLFLDELLEQADVPVIINDLSALAMNEPKATLKWNKKLLEKIAGITGQIDWQQTDKSKCAAISGQKELAKNIWVLGASLGGPDALKQFLSYIPASLPVTFIIAQHLGENFVSLLAEQLNRFTEFDVILAKEGHVVRHQEALVVPTDKKLIINSIGAVEYNKMTTPTMYSPSIDNAINDAVVRYKNNVGVIIFSGMCDDGVAGCETVAKKSGEIWVQDPESCVISAMPENVINKVPVKYIATPENLARKLISIYQTQ